MTFYTNKINNLDKSFFISPDKENYFTKNEIYYPSSQNEWNTSLYSFNKNYVKSIPSRNINIYKLLTSYFNMNIKKSKKFFNNVTKIEKNDYSFYLKSNIQEKEFVFNALLINQIKKMNNLKKRRKDLKKRKLKKTRFSLKKTFISVPENKHLNHEIIITISLYNREYLLLKKKIFKIFKRLFFKKKFYKIKKLLINKQKSLLNTAFYNIYLKKLNIKNKWFLYKNKKNKKNNNIKKIHTLICKYNTLYNNTKINIFNSNTLELSNLNLNKKERKIKLFIKRKYKYLLILKYYILMWSLYKYKYNNNNLIGLRNIISKIYNKTPYFNIIKLKYFYLDSNIIASLITKKLKDRKKKVLIILKRALKKVKKFKFMSIWHGKFDLNKLPLLYQNENILLNKNISNKNLVKYKDFLLRNKTDIVSVILYNTKYKILNGIRLQGGGRLTKRLTALRSVSKTNYVGSLKNINSSTLGLSTIMLKGYCKSNLQYININSYNRNGSFGVKASIASF